MQKEKLIIPLVIILVLTGTYFLISQKPKSPEAPQNDLLLQITSTPQENKDLSLQITSSPQKIMELKIEDIVVGTGQEVKSGDTVFMHYIGTLEDGTKFDSSYDRGQPFETQIGVGQVIQGWDQGVPGMKVGGKRKLIIPSEMAYGSRGAGNIIPPNATLIFEVELVDIID